MSSISNPPNMHESEIEINRFSSPEDIAEYDDDHLVVIVTKPRANTEPHQEFVSCETRATMEESDKAFKTNQVREILKVTTSKAECQSTSTSNAPTTDLFYHSSSSSADNLMKTLSLDSDSVQEISAEKALRAQYLTEKEHRRAVASDTAWRNMRPSNRYDGTMGLQKKDIRRRLLKVLLAMLELSPADEQFRFYLETCFEATARQWVVTWAASEKRWDPLKFEKAFCDRFLSAEWNNELLRELRNLTPFNGLENYVKSASVIIQAMDTTTGDEQLCAAFLQNAPPSILKSFKSNPTMNINSLMKVALRLHYKETKSERRKANANRIIICAYCRSLGHTQEDCTKRTS